MSDSIVMRQFLVCKCDELEEKLGAVYTPSSTGCLYLYHARMVLSTIKELKKSEIETMQTYLTAIQSVDNV